METSPYLFEDSLIWKQTFEKLIRFIRIGRVILYQFNKRLYSRCHKSVINHSRVAFELLFRSYPCNRCIHRIHHRPPTDSAVSAHVRLFWYSRKLAVYGISSPDIPIVCHAKQAHHEIIITTWSLQ